MKNTQPVITVFSTSRVGLVFLLCFPLYFPVSYFIFSSELLLRRAITDFCTLIFFILPHKELISSNMWTDFSGWRTLYVPSLGLRIMRAGGVHQGTVLFFPLSASLCIRYVVGPAYNPLGLMSSFSTVAL